MKDIGAHSDSELPVTIHLLGHLHEALDDKPVSLYPFMREVSLSLLQYGKFHTSHQCDPFEIITWYIVVVTLVSKNKQRSQKQ